MDQTNTTRSILIVMIGVIVAGSSLTAIHTLSADSTNRSHINDNINNISPARQQQPVIQNAAISPSNEGNGRRGDGGISSDISVSGNVSADSNIGVSGEVEEFVMQQQQQLQEQQQAVPISAACGQVVSGVVNLTANLNCSSGDGLIVGGPNTVINMNGFSITGSGQDSSKVGIMVPNVDNVVVNGPGSISNFQAGVLLTGATGFTINSAILSNNQIGTFMTGAENAQVQQNIIQGNSIGVASHSSTGSAIDSNLMNGNLLAGITFVNTQQSNVGMNNVVGSQNGVFLDGQSLQNTISANNVLENIIDLNNANGLPTNINANQYVDNSCETSNPSGLCIGK
jgi:Periplasmic copper-binding protein (NosD)